MDGHAIVLRAVGRVVEQRIRDRDRLILGTIAAEHDEMPERVTAYVVRARFGLARALIEISAVGAGEQRQAVAERLRDEVRREVAPAELPAERQVAVGRLVAGPVARIVGEVLRGGARLELGPQVRRLLEPGWV